MSDVSKLKINNTTYNIKDALALRDAPTDGFEYVRKNGVWTISSGGGGGGGDGIIFNDDTAVIQPGGAYLGNSIEFSNNSAIIRTSEETANGFVKKSGDTITGSLIHETSGEYGLIIRQINDSSVLPSENIYSRGIAFHDKNDNPLGYFRQVLSTTGTSSIDFTGQKNVNGTNIYNILSVGVNADGSGYVYLSEPAAWRDALGLTWTKAGSATNTNTVTIPATAIEVIATVQPGTNDAIFTACCLKSALKSIWFIGGYYMQSGDYAIINLNVSNSSRTFQLRNVVYGNGVNLKTNSTLTIYYR